MRSIRRAGSPSSPTPRNRPPARAASSPVCASIEFDGILLAPAEGTSPEAVDELKRNGIPVVQMLRRVGRQSADYVSADFRLGMNSGG